MSYYEPFYYPYFSARSELPPSLVELDRKIALNNYSKHPYSFIDEQVRISHLDPYPNAALLQAEMQRISSQRMIQAEIEAQMSMKKQESYLQRIAALRRQRDLLDSINKPIDQYVRNRAQHPIHKQMTDDELLNYYSTGQRLHNYQKQIKEKFNTKQKEHERRQREAITAKLAYSQETQNSPKKIEKPVQQSERQRIKEEAIKRSYIEELNQSRGQGSIEKINKEQLLRGATLDVLPQSKRQSPLKHRYGPYSKRKKSKKGNKSISYQGKKHYRDISYIGNTNNRTFTSNTINQAMKKINNRLKVSSIVYKDSKLRNQRHQIEHLSNTFENEVRGRRQVKDKINNNPDILKKHKMVVSTK